MNEVVGTTELYYSTLAEDPDLFDLVEMFVDELPERLELIARSVLARDWDTACRLAHQLKGAGGSHGFPQLTPVTYRLEQAIRDARPHDEIDAALEELRQICARVRPGVPARS